MQTQSTTLHIRFNGRSEDLDLRDLELRTGASDDELRTALARRYGCSPATLDGYVIVREDKALIVRPVAYYG